MKEVSECNNISDIRDAIDYIDEHIILLIAKRSEYVKKAATYKKDQESVRAKDRVEKMLSKRRKLAENNNLNQDFIEQIFKSMVNHFVNQELKDWDKNQ